MSSLAIASILEELRCMDGELFKAEICQRLFLWLKSQASESLETMFAKSPAEYAKILDMYRTWSPSVCEEELSALEDRAGGKEELNSAWIAVSMLWVRLNKKSDSSKTSVKIRTPDVKELLKKFFVLLCSKTWCIKGELWSMDPMKQDFVFREVFRQSVGNSVHFIQEEEKEVKKEESRNEKEVRQAPKAVEQESPPKESREREMERNKESEKRESEERQRKMLEREEKEREQILREQRDKEQREREDALTKEDVEREQEGERAELDKEADEKPLESEKDNENNGENEKGAEVSAELSNHPESKVNTSEDEDDIGPDDSVSHFFGGSRIEPPSFPVAPKRYADAGTVLYTAAPKRVLVKPITLKLENPIQKIQEE